MKDTREQIIKKTIELFQKQGYENTSVASICKACNITKGTFYYHFANKDEITFAFYENLFQNYSEVVTALFEIENSKEQLWSLIEYSIDNTIALTPQLLKAFLISDMQNGLNFFSPYKSWNSSKQRLRQHEMQISLIKKGQKLKEIKEGNPELMLHTFVSALIGIAMDWASNDGPYDEKEELRKVFDVIF